MGISLPIDKINRISKFANDLLAQKRCIIRIVAKMIGLVVSAFKTVLSAQLQYRPLKHLKLSALAVNNNNFDAAYASGASGPSLGGYQCTVS